MSNKSEIQIFLAHANEDKPRVLLLYQRLKQAGYKPWLDNKDLLPGQNWRVAITNAIKKSQLFIACFSHQSITKQGYVQKEFKLALSKYAEMPPDAIYFIPLRLDDCEIPELRQEEYGVNLRDLQWLDYWEEDGFEKLEKAIAFQYGPFESVVTSLVPSPAPEMPLTVTSPLPIFNFDIVIVNARGEEVKKESKQAQYFTENLGNGITLDMVAIPGGKFLMGTEDEEIERLVKKFNWDGFRTEKPQHEVTIQPFFMGKYPITQAEWRAIASRTNLQVERELNFNPAYFKGDERPVEQVSWYDAVEFCARLTKLTGREYRLPSEAQWEYACRSVISYQLSVTSRGNPPVVAPSQNTSSPAPPLEGGESKIQNPSNSPLFKGGWGESNSPFYFGETITSELANYRASSIYADEPAGQYREQTIPVGQFLPNSFGLYDMHGTVLEWCEDDWHNNYEDAPTDGRAWLEENATDANTYKLLRGGCWYYDPGYCRSAYRYGITRDNRFYGFGFRVCCVLPRTLLST